MRETVLSASVALLGSPGPWPLCGHFRGERTEGDVSLAWAGRVAADAGPEAGWRTSRRIDRAVREARWGPDRRHALAEAWLALDALIPAAWGPGGGADLVLLLAAVDPEGAAVAGVGLGAVLGLSGETVLEPWIVPPHPLLGGPGRPGARRSALSVEALPGWLVGVPHEAAVPRSMGLAEALLASGVRR